jgi:biopolymer transport protein TolR
VSTGFGNPPRNLDPTVGVTAPPGPVAAPPKARRHRRWLIHSHEATRPGHVDAVSEINITPLIDVMLVLLIIFMVVTPLTQKGLDIALPQANTQTQQQQQADTNQVVLAIDDTGMSVNKSPVASMEELENRLRDIFQARSDKTVFVRASGKVPYGKVVEAMDIAKAAGVERIGIISQKMIEEAGGTPEGGAPPK